MIVREQNRRPDGLVEELRLRFGEASVAAQETRDVFPTLWVPRDRVAGILTHLKAGTERPYRMLYDLTAIDEREREHREGQPDSDFTVVYHLLSFERNDDVRVKVALMEEDLTLPSMTPLWPAADWYEREIYDMFGIAFDGHPNLLRILMPAGWKGHPLRKDHPARATDMPPFELPEDRLEEEEKALQFHPERWGLKRRSEQSEFMFLNIGPQHPGTHGVLRIVLELDGEDIVNAVCDIGFHHRGAEKMGERQSWHTFIPYSDRVEYLGGAMNNLAYVLAVERLAGIEVPERAQVARVMLCELFRISSHLVWFGTFAQDLGQLSPVFYMFTDREKVLDIVAALCGARMHPNWFRIGGLAQDLPKGWQEPVGEFVRAFPRRLKEYDSLVMKNRIFKARTVGIGAYTLDEAIEWGVTGPGMRACGLEWDFRKKRPYSGYDRFDFDIPTGRNGDCYDRARVRVEEIRQSLRIVEQCLKEMPAGEYKSRHPLATPPLKGKTLADIETLIGHFLGVSWGPVIPAGEAFHGIEATKGNNGYYLVSDGGVLPYRLRIRTPSFPHIQMVPTITRGHTIPDLLAILGSVDYVLSDVDR
jgi:NADH-quinone oxidoreductase subunit C/D